MIFKKISVSIALLALLLCEQTATADLAVNFTNGDGPRQILAGESTGVIPVADWLNIDVEAASAPERIDVSGSIENVGGTSVNLSWQSAVLQGSNSARGAGGDGTDATQALYGYGLRDNSGAEIDDTQFTISNLNAHLISLSASSYNLYVYYKSTVNAANDALSIGLDAESLSDVDPAPAGTIVDQPFILNGNPDSNYVVFSNLTADSTTVLFSRAAAGGRDGIIAGFQIEVNSVPEPSSALLLSSLLLVLGVRRRRA